MSDEIESKITDEHRAMVGREMESYTVRVREEDARRVRELFGDSDARWAEGTGMAPPYVIGVLQGGPRRGAGPSILPGGIMTQKEWRFTRPFRIGEELRAVPMVVDIRERLSGSYGYSVLVTSATDYYDAEGAHVAAALPSVTQFDPAAARRRE